MAKRLPRPEPITFEEIKNSPSLQGFEEFLQFRPGDASSGKSEGFLKAVVLSITQKVSPAEPIVAGPASPGVAGPATTGVNLGDLWTGETLGGIFPASRLQAIKLAQHALNHPENATYNLLWKEGQPFGGRDRTITVGYDRIAKATRITKRNTLAILQRLEAKGFIRVLKPPDSIRNVGTTYAVHSYVTVLESQRRLDRRWVVRIGSGVDYARRLITTPTTPDTQAPMPVVVGPASPGDAGLMTPGDVGLTTPGDVGPASPVDAPSTGILSTQELGERGGRPSSSLETLVAEIASFDDDACRQLIDACRKVARDVTEDEIAHFVGQKLLQLRKKQDIQNPVGLLLKSVPVALKGSGLQRYRQAKAEEQHQVEESRRRLAEQTAELIADCEQTLADPEADEKDKADAQAFLDEFKKR